MTALTDAPKRPRIRRLCTFTQKRPQGVTALPALYPEIYDALGYSAGPIQWTYVTEPLVNQGPVVRSDLQAEMDAMEATLQASKSSPPARILPTLLAILSGSCVGLTVGYLLTWLALTLWNSVW